jgi:hypothetical protein
VSEAEGEDVVGEALANVPPQTKMERKAAEKPLTAKDKQKGARYAHYAPAKFAKHPLARIINVAVDFQWPEQVDETTREVLAPSTQAVELGEAATAALWWGLGLPPMDSLDGEGHPYITAMNRAHKFATPRVLRSQKFRAWLASWRKKEQA